MTPTPQELARKIRRRWCSYLHDRCWRLHAWFMADSDGTIECARCGTRREPFRSELLTAGFMRDVLAEYRAAGWLPDGPALRDVDVSERPSP